jgi:hypothetical protein
MSLHVTPQDLQSAANALSGVHRDTGLEGVKTAGSLDAESAGHWLVAMPLGEICRKLELGASAFRGIVLHTQRDLCKTGDDYCTADHGGASLLDTLTSLIAGA